MPSTAALVSFEAAARHESFTNAAEELSLTQSAICRQIALWVRDNSSAALVKLSWRAAASKLTSAAVEGILRRLEDSGVPASPL